MRHPFSLELSDLEPSPQQADQAPETLTDAEAAAVGGGLSLTTKAFGEEGGCLPDVTTLALGEEGGGPVPIEPICKPLPPISPCPPLPRPICPPIRPIKPPIKPPIATTLALGEEGGGYWIC